MTGELVNVGTAVKRTALDICQANAVDAAAKKAAMRAKFPTCAGFIDELAKEGFRPRVVSMSEGGNEWRRGAK